jgi:hypothetical protein
MVSKPSLDHCIQSQQATYLACFPTLVFIALLRTMLQGNHGREMAKLPFYTATQGDLYGQGPLKIAQD